MEQAEKQEDTSSTIILPGYMLLIDEPEVGMHPNAIRAANSYLYKLSKDPSLQLMLTTHSPAFINPLEDHTTIVRLDRTGSNLSPKLYRSDDSRFKEPEKRNLQMLNRFDTGLAEMFFGQYPILIEGDTEFAAFEKILNDCPERYPKFSRPVLVRGRGKDTLALVVRILAQFKVNFSILHDSDYPKTTKGGKNNAWSANERLYHAIISARANGCRVIHRVSVSTFELAHAAYQDKDGQLLSPQGNDKPFRLIEAMETNKALYGSIETLLVELINHDSSQEPFKDGVFMDWLQKEVTNFAERNFPEDRRFEFQFNVEEEESMEEA